MRERARAASRESSRRPSNVYSIASSIFHNKRDRRGVLFHIKERTTFFFLEKAKSLSREEERRHTQGTTTEETKLRRPTIITTRGNVRALFSTRRSRYCAAPITERYTQRFCRHAFGSRRKSRASVKVGRTNLTSGGLTNTLTVERRENGLTSKENWQATWWRAKYRPWTSFADPCTRRCS